MDLSLNIAALMSVIQKNIIHKFLCNSTNFSTIGQDFHDSSHCDLLLKFIKGKQEEEDTGGRGEEVHCL